MLKRDIPNILTIMRIVLIPILILSFYLQGESANYVASAIFISASITDFFDGYLARTLQAQSDFGRMLDPIADKLLIASTLAMLIHFHRVPIFPAIAILCREILVSGLRENLAEMQVHIKVSFLAKIKTAVQMIAIILLLLSGEVLNIKYVDIVGEVAIWIAAGLTLFTGYAYLRAGFKHIK